MLDVAPDDSFPLVVPLGCALNYSSPLERRAVVIRQAPGPLSDAAYNGMTAIPQAIVYHDVDVVSALLEAGRFLASAPLRNPRDPGIFNLPIHFAAQLAAQRGVPDGTRILEPINSHREGLDPQKPPPFDSMTRTPLHLAVTGPARPRRQPLGFLKSDQASSTLKTNWVGRLCTAAGPGPTRKSCSKWAPTSNTGSNM